MIIQKITTAKASSMLRTQLNPRRSNTTLPMSNRPQPQTMHRRQPDRVLNNLRRPKKQLQARHNVPIITHFHKLKPLHFPAGRARYFIYENDTSRQGFVAYELMARKPIDFVPCEACCGCGFASHHEGTHELVFELVGGAFLFDADDRCVGDARVFEEDTLDFGRRNLPSIMRAKSLVYAVVRKEKRDIPPDFDEFFRSSNDIVHAGAN